ncbi:MAG: hypothetical protein CMJ50_06050 [Planctomycetaceae bacterium]|nr:hypothetical protein [Planctomycetaceae bacterium]
MKDLREHDVRQESTPHPPSQGLDEACSLGHVARHLSGPVRTVYTPCGHNTPPNATGSNSSLCIALIYQFSDDWLSLMSSSTSSG